MSDRFEMRVLSSLYKGVTIRRAHVLMSGTTPVLRKWNYPGLNSGTSGAYVNAPTTFLAQGGIGTASEGAEGVLTVTRTGVGLWTFQLQDNFNRLLEVMGHQSLAGGLSTIVAIGINSTLTSMSAANGSKIGIALLSSTATAADPADATEVTVSFLLQNSTTP